MAEPVGETVARIDQNVIYILKTLDDHAKNLNDHITEDKKIQTDFIFPMWNERNQRIGAEKARNNTGIITGWAINIVIAAATAWAMIKSINIK